MSILPRLLLIALLVLGVAGVVLLATFASSPPIQRIEIVLPDDRFPR